MGLNEWSNDLTFNHLNMDMRVGGTDRGRKGGRMEWRVEGQGGGFGSQTSMYRWRVETQEYHITVAYKPVTHPLLFCTYPHHYA